MCVNSRKVPEWILINIEADVAFAIDVSTGVSQPHVIALLRQKICWTKDRNELLPQRYNNKTEESRQNDLDRFRQKLYYSRPKTFTLLLLKAV